jgi:hypothetical protein
MPRFLRYQCAYELAQLMPQTGNAEGALPSARCEGNDSQSLLRDADLFHHRPPQLLFAADELGRLSRRHGAHERAEVGKPLPHGRLIEHGAQIFAYLAHDPIGCTGRCEQRERRRLRSFSRRSDAASSACSRKRMRCAATRKSWNCGEKN